MASGYVKLYRAAEEHQVFEDDWLWKVFTWCIMRANFRDAKVPRGSFTTGRIEAADRLRSSPSRVYRALKKLEKLGCITIKSNNRFTTVSVCNYGIYQSDEESARTTDEQPKNSQRTTNGQPANSERTHLEEGKEGKKGKREEVPTVFPPSLDNPEFATAWRDWQQHRREIGKPLKPTSASKQLAKLESLGPVRAIAAIEHSIAGGWQGIFEDKSAVASAVMTCKPLEPHEFATWNPVDGGGV